jgi:thioredoxin reductase (NADPH)
MPEETDQFFDVVIAGGGPAGMSALLWCAELGLRAVLLEREAELGGQLLQTHNAVRNYLGVETSNGRDLRDVFLRQIARLNIATSAEIVEADLASKRIRLADRSTFSCRAIFIATGVRRRKLMVPGEEEFRGRGILESGVKAGEQVRGGSVVIVGGGDAALENALILSQTAAEVHVVHRRHEFTARSEYVKRAKRTCNIKIVPNSKITKIAGNKCVDFVEIEHLTSGKRSRLEADAVLLRIGVEPNTDLFRGQIDLDDVGYVRINNSCETSMRCIFAGGDAANPATPTISVAVGNGAAAAKAALEEISERTNDRNR